MLLSELMARVIASKNPRITRIYLSDDEYRQILRERAVLCWENWRYDRTTGKEVRVSLAGATCYRLSEIR